MPINKSKNNKKVTNDSDNDDQIILKSKTKTTKKLIQKNNIDDSYLKLQSNEIIFKLENNNDNSDVKPILKMIDKAHNILFQAENIVGQKALQIIMSLLFLKLIQSYLSENNEEGKIDLLNKKYYLDKYDDNEDLDKILGYFKDLTTLTCQGLKTIRNDSNVDAIKQMGEILKRHSITKMIYTETNFIKVKLATTIQTLINDVINKIDFNNLMCNEDVIGEIYEHMLNKYVKNDSKELGQYFTPRKLMKLILEFKKSRINELFTTIDNKKISICDPCMGTAGWLVSGYNMFNNTSGNRLNVSGGEVEPETFQYSLMNIILTLHRFPDDIQCNSSLTHINRNKHNLILTNPPFNSKKQIKFSQIEKNFKNDTYTTNNNISIDDIYQLKKDDPPIQFLELDTYKLANNGMCIIVLPYGEFFSGNSFSKTREHFLKTINITDIILVPGGIFTHTGIKTCIMIFEKNNQTINIRFSKINQLCDQIEHITTVNINDINREPCLSWYHMDYLHDKLIFDLNSRIANFEWIEFGQIFSLVKGKLQSTKVEEDEEGEGVFINLSKSNDFKKINNTILDGENIFISNTAPLGLIQYYNGKCNYSDLLQHIKVNENYINKVNIKYIYYFLKSINEHIKETYDKGSCNKSLDQKNFNRMKIPIPPLNIQLKIINRLDLSDNKVKYAKLIVEVFKEDINTFFEWTVDIETRKPETQWIEFGKVFTLLKGKLQSTKVEEDEEGDGVFINLSKSNDFKKINNTILDGENIFISNTAPLGLIQYYNGKCNYSDLLQHIKINDNYINKVNIKYTYYFLKSINQHIKENYYKGSCNQSLDQKNFNRMKIQIPTIQQQNKCIEKITQMEEIIKRWNIDIADIQENGSDKFLEFLEAESIRYIKE